MPQNKITILSTRSLRDEFIRDAESKDILIDVVPFIKTEFIASEETQHKIEKASTVPATIVFTSGNAVEAVAQKIKDQNPAWEIFCISHATMQSAEKYFGKKSIAGVADNAKELAESIINSKANQVIFFCGDHRRDELPELLKKSDTQVKEIMVYKTIITPQKIEKNYDGILFFSPSAVKSFFLNNKGNDQTILFAIGNTTADEIKKFSKNKMVISDKPDKTFLLEKVSYYFKTNPVRH